MPNSNRCEAGKCMCYDFLLLFPAPCLSCGLGLVHYKSAKAVQEYCCDSCDTWSFKDGIGDIITKVL